MFLTLKTMISGPPSAPPTATVSISALRKSPLINGTSRGNGVYKNDDGIRGLKSVILRWSIRLQTMKKQLFPIYSIIEHFYVYYSTNVIMGSRFNQHYTKIIYHHI